MSKVNTIVWGLLSPSGRSSSTSPGPQLLRLRFRTGPGVLFLLAGDPADGAVLVQIILIWRRPAEPSGRLHPHREGVKRILSILLALAASLALMNTLGFCLTIMGFCIFLLRRLGHQPWWLTLALSVAAGFGTFYLFGLLQVMLPKGFLGFI
jgi:hypothetical protein